MSIQGWRHGDGSLSPFGEPQKETENRPHVSNRPCVSCVIMAAGSSSRYGEDKLLAPLKGKMLIEWAFDAVPEDRLTSVIVVSGSDRIRDLAIKRGFRYVENCRPEEGVSRTIRLGTEALKDECSAILYMVSDQPLLKRQSVSDLIDFYLDNPEKIVSMSYGGERGNPCIFPVKYFDLLQNLEGDRGGSVIIRSHPEDLLLFEADPVELKDIDTVEDHHFLEYGVSDNGSEKRLFPSS